MDHQPPSTKHHHSHPSLLGHCTGPSPCKNAGINTQIEGQPSVDVTVIRAQDLPRLKNLVGKKRRFFVTLTSGTTTKKTAAIRSMGQAVHWNETLGAYVGHHLRLSIYAKRFTGKDILAGTLEIPFDSLHSSSQRETELPFVLNNPGTTQQPTVYLKIIVPANSAINTSPQDGPQVGRGTAEPLAKSQTEKSRQPMHYASPLPSSYSSPDNKGPRQSPHPEVRWDDDSVTGPSAVPVPDPDPTQPTTAEHPQSFHVSRDVTATPRSTYDDRGRLEALNVCLHSTLITARNAEERREADFLAQDDRREDEFRDHEGNRQHYFEEGKGRRNAEARQRPNGIWQELETRLEALPASSPSRPVSAAASIRDLAQQAALQHANDVIKIVRLERDTAKEREALAAERAQFMAEISAQKDAIKDGHIATLEDELARVRAELDEERQRSTENSEMKAREREEIERDENIRAQLGDITNLVQDQRDMYETTKASMDARWEQNDARREDENAQMIELRDMVQGIHDDMAYDRSRCEDERRESQDSLQRIIEELRAENAQQRELSTTLSESWRADCERHHQETIESVRSILNEQVPFNVQGYIDDFSRALSTEVRMLLGEVGRIREERRALQHEIGELLCMKSKYGPGGEFEPDWTPPRPPGPPPPDVPPIPDPTEPPAVRPAWRPYHPRGKKKKKEPKAEPSQIDRDLRQQMASWSTWHPDPDVVLTPPPVEPSSMMPDRSSPGLFGPKTPSSSIYDQGSPDIRPAWRTYHPRGKRPKVASPPTAKPPQMGPSPMDRDLRQVASWSTWHPDPDPVLTPLSVEPTLMVPDRPSPGLFGPRSASSSIYDEYH